MKALRYLRLFPKVLRPIVGNFGSECRQLRHVLAQTRQLTDKVLQERQIAKMRGLEVEDNDALTWAEELAKTKGIRSDAATWQLALSTVALHTSSDLIGQAVLDLCEHPELLQPLREEIYDMMWKDGRDATHCKYSKADMQSLSLMDSVLKESQRLKPVSLSKRVKPPCNSVPITWL
jgi:cytochrome P450